MPPSKPNLTQNERDEMVQFLMDRATNVVAEDGSVARALPKGTVPAASDKFNVNRSAVQRIWKRAKENFVATNVMKSVSKMKENSGRQLKYDRAMVKEDIAQNFDVIHAVYYAWGRFNDRQLEKAFCTLQTVFEEIIKCQGGSQYRIPHIRKEAIWRVYGIHVLRELAEQASQDAIDIVEEVFGV